MSLRLLAIAGVAIAAAGVAQAQIVRDGTIGPGSGVQPAGPNYLIPESMGEGVGPNLFHSFEDFNLAPVESALFTAVNPYDNLIARVTGGDPSFLDGTLASTITGADFYFLNPAGVIAGPNFVLDVPASFYLSTSDRLDLGDGLGSFDASDPGATILSSAAPSAFGFDGPAAAPISLVQTTLVVASGEAITVVGGTIDQSGGVLFAPSGRVDLIAVASAGEVAFDSGDRSTPPDVSGVDAFDTVNVRDGALIDVSGDPAGSIFVRGSSVSFDQATLLANAFGAFPGAALGIDVGASLDLSISTGSFLQSASGAGTAHAGAMRLFAGSDVLISDSVLSTISLASGNSGGLLVSAGRDLSVRALDPSFLTSIESTALGFGSAGSISLLAGRDLAVEGAGIDSSGFGNFSFGSGSISLLAGRDIWVGGAQIDSSGFGIFSFDAGNVELWSGRDVILFDTLIDASANGDGAAGNVEIDADRDVWMQLVGIDTRSRFGFAGPAGPISVHAGNDLFADLVSFDTRSDSFFGAPAGGVEIEALAKVGLANSLIETTSFSGAGGTVSISGSDVTLDNTQAFSFVLGDAPGGSMFVVGDRVLFENMSDLGTIMLGSGQGGSISLIATGSITFRTGSSASTSTEGTGNAGSVLLTAPEISLLGDGDIGSGIITTNTSSSGNAGSLTIDSQRFSMTNGFGITTISSGLDGVLPAGRAGDVSVVATESAIISGDSGIFSSTLGDGDAADITITSPDVVLDGGQIGAFSADELVAGNRGNSGDVTLHVGDLVLRNSAGVAGGTAGSTTLGAGGTLTIDATGNVSIETNSSLLNGVEGVGNGGPLSITASSLTVSDGLIESQTIGEGNAGPLTIDVGSLLVEDGGMISTLSNGAGDGSQLDIRARDSVKIRGAAPNGFPSIITSEARSSGSAGTITISGPQGGPRLAALDMNGGRITTDSSGSSDAGSISIDADVLTMQNDALITSSTSGDGTGGSITADTRITKIFDSSISTLSEGTGDAGRISLDASKRLKMLRGRITSRADNAFGGSIAINGEGIERLPNGTLVPITGESPTNGIVQLVNSEITTSVGNGVGNGGNALVDGSILVLDDSRITATAVGGDGGNILLASDVVFANTENGDLGVEGLLDASSSLGVNGVVSIRSPEVDLASDLAPLPLSYLDASSLMRPECAARRRDGSHLTYSTGASPPASAEGFWFEAPIDPEVARLRALSQKARIALDAGERGDAERVLGEAETAAAALPVSADLIHLWIHLAASTERLARATQRDERRSLLLRAHAGFTRALELADELADDRARSYALGNLAGLYARQARFDEALQLSRRAIVAAAAAEADEAEYRWRWQAARSLWAQGKANDGLIEYRSAVEGLHRLRQVFSGQSPEAATWFQRDAAPLYLEFVDALLAGAARAGDPTTELALLLDARAIVEMLKAAELRDYFRDECVAAFEAKVTDIDRVSKTAAVVYPILLDDRLELLVTLPSGLQRFAVPVPAERVAAQARRFNQALQIRASRRYLAAGKELYEWLVAPYAPALAAESVDTLVFVPDGALRAIPMAALHDGERFLIERYAVAVAPGLSLVEPKPMDPHGANILLGGISEAVGGFSALPSVDAELEAIEGLYGGTRLLNGDFRLARVESEMVASRPTIFHVASHGKFTGDPETSYLLTYDGKLTMDRLRDYLGVAKYRDDPLELLVLSACETAAGDERAALGLAGVAIRAGARSAIGSLWQVNDVATRELIVEFYTQLGDPSLSKAKALQRAQQKLLATKVYSHPVYWSPFLMISNWL